MAGDWYILSENFDALRRDLHNEESSIAGEAIVGSGSYGKTVVEEGRPLDRETMPARDGELEHGCGCGGKRSIKSERLVVETARSCRVEDNMLAEWILWPASEGSPPAPHRTFSHTADRVFERIPVYQVVVAAAVPSPRAKPALVWI